MHGYSKRKFHKAIGLRASSPWWCVVEVAQDCDRHEGNLSWIYFLVGYFTRFISVVSYIVLAIHFCLLTSALNLLSEVLLSFFAVK